MGYSLLKQYYYLTKPGIIYGNALPALAGFFLASKHHVHLSLLFFMIVGLSLVIASACVFNNYLDRNIDAAMQRTKHRALVSKQISPSSALIYGSVLGIIGALILDIHTTILTMLIALLGFVVYVVFYGVGKRRSPLGTLIGSVAGAVPPVVGYTAVTNQLDSTAVILFFILVFWQMPHFYGIALYRYKDYKNAGLPVLPVKKGAWQTKLQTLCYIVAFTVVALLLSVFGSTGIIYAIIVLLLGTYWFFVGLTNFNRLEDALWGRKVFLTSLVVLTVLCATISVDAFLI